MRVNLGCGDAYLEGWVNVDESPEVKADVHATAFDFVLAHGSEITEMYMGHFLEHLMPHDADAILALLAETLPEGAEVSAVTPDMRAVFAAYDAGEIDNVALNHLYVYSYAQPSHHVWCYDEATLLEAFQRAGFNDIEVIDPLTWPPVFHKTGPDSRWQCGVRATVPSAAAVGAVRRNSAEVLPSGTERLPRQLRQASQGALGCDEDRAAEEAASEEVYMFRSSRTHPLAARFRQLSAAIVPSGGRRRRMANMALRTLRPRRPTPVRLEEQWQESGSPVQSGRISYEQWCQENDASEQTLDRQRHAAVGVVRPLRVKVLVLGGSDSHVRETIHSVIAQSWPQWEATIVRNEPPDPGVMDLDARIGWLPSADDDLRALLDGVNQAIRADDEVDAPAVRPAREFMVCLAGGDRLAPDCLYEVAMAAMRDPLVDLAYWDDDLVDANGVRRDPRFRPSWSPEMLLGVNFVGWSFAMRCSRFVDAGGIRVELEEACLWDLLLRSRITSATSVRVPRVLGHLRSRRDDVTELGSEAVNDFLDSEGLPARAEVGAQCLRLRWSLERWPTVSVIIPSRHNRPMLARCVTSLGKTDYPSFEVMVVDNGEHSEENEAWYDASFPGMDLHVKWWEEAFNYSAVNNVAARCATGEVLVFLNDDTEVLDGGWLRELVGWAEQSEIGAVGLQLLDEHGNIQFAGTVVGLGGFADHVFEGMKRGSDTLLGPTSCYRNVLAVTGACMAVRRERFERVGGFDERFALCGSDVALGLDLAVAGFRNLCSPFAPLRHLESATRGRGVPPEDLSTMYWRYRPWLFGGDPYFSPNVALTAWKPELKKASDRSVEQLMSGPLQRQISTVHERSDAQGPLQWARSCVAGRRDVRSVKALHRANAGAFDPEVVNWFIPDLEDPFAGSINTALRIADHVARNNGVQNRFVVCGPGPERYIRAGIATPFPALAASPIVFHDGSARAFVPPSDVSIATDWVTAYRVAHFADTRRKFYLIQDFEPSHYSTGTMYALAEESYRLGLYGLCRTDLIRRIYTEEYGGTARAFAPAFDPGVFHADGRADPSPEAPVTVFAHAGTAERSCWALAGVALEDLKRRLGDRVRIVTAGWSPALDGVNLEGVVNHLGPLDHRATGKLFRSCDVGLALSVAKHPSHLPLELIACGVPVVAFDRPNAHWLLRDGENSLLTGATSDAVVDALERLVVDPALRARLARNGLADVAAHHSSWEKSLAAVYGFLRDPEGGAEG